MGTAPLAPFEVPKDRVAALGTGPDPSIPEKSLLRRPSLSLAPFLVDFGDFTPCHAIGDVPEGLRDEHFLGDGELNVPM